MFEKIKDLIYDLSDYLVTIIIVFFIVISIAFVMTKSYGLDFSKNDLLSLFNKEIVKEEIKAPEKTPDTTPATGTPTTGTPTPTPTPAPQTPTPTPAPAPTTPDKDKEENKDIVIEVYPGDGSYDIGERLVEAGVLKDSSEFAIALMERGLDTDLQVGEYTFKKNMTLDQVIAVLFP